MVCEMECHVYLNAGSAANEKAHSFSISNSIIIVIFVTVMITLISARMISSTYGTAKTYEPDYSEARTQLTLTPAFSFIHYC